ncbi:MAG: tRNA (N6-threonylcarbamoyladenosine(37)-N6)-methyltransferase TrmO [Butyricicoccus sp.]
METGLTLKTIAHIHTDFPTKFGIPRQSGIVDALKAVIVFTPEYRNPDALRGLEDFSHLWLIWEFSEAVRDTWSPTVRPPRLGGNKRMGVFATRSPFRPNALGLSSVQLDSIDLHTPDGPVLHVSGADLMDGTPIYDIKPYLPFADSHPDARQGFTAQTQDYALTVDFPAALLEQVPASLRDGLIGTLAHDPRPSYQNDPERVYYLEFADLEIGFRVDRLTLTVCQVQPRKIP